MRRQLMATQAQQIKKRQQIEEFVNRFRAKASKARQAQSKLKQLNKIEVVSVKSLPIKARINIPEPVRTPKKLIELKGVQLGYDPDIAILKNVDLSIERGQHMAVVGFNGAGKSTLLKALAQRLPVQKGERLQTDGIDFSYFSQHVHEQLDEGFTVFEELQAKAHPDVTRQQILDTAGALLFAGDDIHKKISWLSGGERMRVALGQILLSKTSLMLLDEPTNHLDFHTVEALAEALKRYNGALIVVKFMINFNGSAG
ncbi:MAG: ATP-binding cassette domain-containing protein [Bdellovibrionales bacterium]